MAPSPFFIRYSKESPDVSARNIRQVPYAKSHTPSPIRQVPYAKSQTKSKMEEIKIEYSCLFSVNSEKWKVHVSPNKVSVMCKDEVIMEVNEENIMWVEDGQYRSSGCGCLCVNFYDCNSDEIMRVELLEPWIDMVDEKGKKYTDKENEDYPFDENDVDEPDAELVLEPYGKDIRIPIPHNIGRAIYHICRKETDIVKALGAYKVNFRILE